MAAALRRRLGTAAAFGCRIGCRRAFSEPLRYSSSGPPQPLRKCASIAEALLVDAVDVDATLLKVEMEPLVLQRRVVVYERLPPLPHRYGGIFHLRQCSDFFSDPLLYITYRHLQLYKGVKWIIRADKDKKIKFCCLQSKAAEPYMKVCGVEREDVLRRFVFVESPNSYHQGSAAALRVVSHLPLPYSALSTLMVVPTPLRDGVYDYVAKRRYDWFGKDEACLVLKETELLERFVDWEELLERSRSKQL